MTDSIRNIKSITRRELGGYFGSPVAYVFIFIFLVLSGFFTFYISNFYETGQADLRPFFQWHPWIYLFLVPAVGMRLWSDERRTRTIELILTMPVTLFQIIVGKFIAAWIFIGIALVLTFPLVLTVVYLGNPDLGAIFSTYFGSFLLAGSYLSVGSVTSAMTKNQVISFILSVMVCLFLVLAGWSPILQILSGWAPVWLIDVVSGFSVMPHFLSMERGVLDLRDIFYFLSIIFFMLFANGLILQNRRAS